MNFSATHQSSPRKMAYRFENNAIKKNSFHSEASKKQNGTNCTLRYANRDDERSCRGTAVHAFGTSQSLLYPFVPASSYCGHGKKKTTIESRQIQKENNEQTDSICDKTFLFSVMISLLTDHGQTAYLPRLKPSFVVSASWQSRKLLARVVLYFRSY